MPRFESNPEPEENKKGPDTKFMVWKLDEVLKVCTKHDLRVLDDIINRVLRMREEEGKNPVNGYVVINTDEPYIDEIKEIMKKYNHWDD